MHQYQVIFIKKTKYIKNNLIKFIYIFNLILSLFIFSFNIKTILF